MGCGCGKKSAKKQSVEATQLQAQLEQARKAALERKHIAFAAPPPSKASTPK